MTETVHPRKTPCASCPYRRSVASGIWSSDEYSKLERYDGDIPDQTAMGVFLCHQQDGCVCAGWLGHRDPTELLAVRLAFASGHLAADSLEYSTTVPLFSSGREAAEHGMAEYTAPGKKAVATIEKLVKAERLREKASE